MALANQEAMRAGHEYIGTEHILLGLLKEGSGVGANVLKILNVDLHKARQEVERVIKVGPGGNALNKRPQTPRAKKVIEFAIAEARNLKHNYVGTEHLLLGLLGEEEGVAAHVLVGLGINLEEAREEILNLLGAGEESPSENVRPPAPVNANSVELDSRIEKLLLECVTAFDREFQEIESARDESVKKGDYEHASQLREKLLKLITTKRAETKNSLSTSAPAAEAKSSSPQQLTPARFILALIDATPELARKFASLRKSILEICRNE